ncbi:MarR family winged helix-turn-helix transcriptional regulator [Methanobrevibacter sp.]|uniref:MarR family winged helix-turn-helix transcriptional regulator n=1 Tax=Methanobrevibacter sp. TaxID=66852 RepID=UPI0025F8A05F|nr:MarR family winged helix-turn-helix transcriptional regulator [Methanobrevibacter sp.]MBR4447778.1 winged helix-turn-helix transcriptional regulator [Methanobrevibacter sp.]
MQFDKDMPTAPFISIIYREHAKYINEIVKEDGLSYGLHPLLVIIYKNEGISQEQLASEIHLNESTITRNLKKLEDKGFIERIKDKRKKIIKLTPKGEKTALKIMNYDEKWDEKIKNNITNEEYDNFLKTLRRISEELI